MVPRHRNDSNIMARRRYVSTDISDDDAVATLVQRRGYLGALLYTWLIPHADDQCNLPAASARKLMVIVMPELALLKGRFRVKVEDVEKIVEDMVDLGLLEQDDGGDYYFPPDSFYRYQTYIPEGKRRASAFVGVERRSSALSGESSASFNVSVTPSPSLSPSPPPVVVEKASEPEALRVLPPLVLPPVELNNIFMATQRMFSRPLTPVETDALRLIEQDFPEPTWRYAIKEAGELNKRSLRYMQSVCQRVGEGDPDEQRPDNRGQRGGGDGGAAQADANARATWALYNRTPTVNVDPWSDGSWQDGEHPPAHQVGLEDGRGVPDQGGPQEASDLRRAVLPAGGHPVP